MPYINKNVNPIKNKTKKKTKSVTKIPSGERRELSGIFEVLAVEAVEKSLTYVSDRWDSQCLPHCNRSAVQSLGLYPSLLRKPCGERYFLVPNKKVTKEVGLRGLLALPRETPRNQGAIAPGNRSIFIRCAEHHSLRIPQALLLQVLPFPHLEGTVQYVRCQTFLNCR